MIIHVYMCEAIMWLCISLLCNSLRDKITEFEGVKGRNIAIGSESLITIVGKGINQLVPN